MTRRRWIAERWDETTATLAGAQAAHLGRVLRAQPGVEADVVAGGRVFRSHITDVLADEVRFELGEEVAAAPALPVTLAMSVFKFDRMEWALEKATELGVATVAPLLAQRTEKHLAQAAEKRVERWRRIVHEAAQQSRRSDVPQVEPPVKLSTHVKLPPAALRIVLAEQEHATTLRQAVEEAMAAAGEELPQLEIAIGPEGGWSAAEETLFAENGWRAVTLGPRILRAETACITALSVVASLYE
jgi:16S rRNA (uracil1498-N3)-methyltransferase